MPVFRTTRSQEHERGNRFYVAGGLDQDAFWSTEELLRERGELLRVLGLRKLDEMDLTLATAGRRYFLEELQELETELDRRDQLEVRKMRYSWRRGYSDSGLLLMARLNQRVRVSGVLDSYGLEGTVLHGYEVYHCPLPTHETVDLTFRVFQDDNSWECRPCGAHGGVYELARWMMNVPLFQRILAGQAESAGVAYDPNRWEVWKQAEREAERRAGEEAERIEGVIDEDAVLEAEIDRVFGRLRVEDELDKDDAA